MSCRRAPNPDPDPGPNTHPGPNPNQAPREETNENVVAVLVRLLLTHETYLASVLKYPR